MRLFEAIPVEGAPDITGPLVAASVSELRHHAVLAHRGNRVLWEVMEYSITAKDVVQLRRTGRWSPDLVGTWSATTDLGTHRQVRWRRL